MFIAPFAILKLLQKNIWHTFSSIYNTMFPFSSTSSLLDLSQFTFFPRTQNQTSPVASVMVHALERSSFSSLNCEAFWKQYRWPTTGASLCVGAWSSSRSSKEKSDWKPIAAASDYIIPWMQTLHTTRQHDLKLFDQFLDNRTANNT